MLHNVHRCNDFTHADEKNSKSTPHNLINDGWPVKKATMFPKSFTNAEEKKSIS